MYTVSHSYNPNIGLEVDQLRGGITLVDDMAHIKVFKQSGLLYVVIIPKYGKVVTDQSKLPQHGVNGVEGYFHAIEPSDPPAPEKHRLYCRHEREHPRVEDRRPSNWCAICKDWFKPSKY